MPASAASNSRYARSMSPREYTYTGVPTASAMAESATPSQYISPVLYSKGAVVVISAVLLQFVGDAGDLCQHSRTRGSTRQIAAVDGALGVEPVTDIGIECGMRGPQGCEVQRGELDATLVGNSYEMA